VADPKLVVKVMVDYDCYPLWDVGLSGPRNLDPESLPISAALVADLMGWASEYDGTLNRENPAASGFPTREAHERFVRMGLGLAERLAEELGASVQVLYYDDVAGSERSVSGAES